MPMNEIVTMATMATMFRPALLLVLVAQLLQSAQAGNESGVCLPAAPKTCDIVPFSQPATAVTRCNGLADSASCAKLQQLCGDVDFKIIVNVSGRGTEQLVSEACPVTCDTCPYLQNYPDSNNDKFNNHTATVLAVGKKCNLSFPADQRLVYELRLTVDQKVGKPTLVTL